MKTNRSSNPHNQAPIQELMEKKAAAEVISSDPLKESK